MSDYLPEEVVIDILQRLPVKILLRCRSVCKTWYSLITSSPFIYTHLHCSNNKAPQLLVRCKDQPDPLREKFVLYYDNATFDSYTEFDSPLVGIDGVFNVVFSCYGLICLCDALMTDMVRIVLWNPLVNRAVLLPKPMYRDCSEDGDDDDSSAILGFGYDFATKDYKLVRIVDFWLDKICPKVEIYRLSTRIWEDISHLALPYLIFPRWVFVNGAIHWIGMDEDRNHLIILFDIHSEVFREMMLPLRSCLENRVNHLGEPFVDCHGSRLLVCEGSLCLIHFDERSGPRFDIWLMKEYGVAKSWVKQYSVSNSELLYPNGVRNNGEILWHTINGGMILNHPQSKQMMEFPIRAISTSNYVESLVLLDSDSCIMSSNVDCNKQNHEIRNNILELEEE